VDHQIAHGSATFSERITISRIDWVLSPAQVAAYRALNSQLQMAYVAPKTPATPTAVFIEQKFVAARSVRGSAKALNVQLRAKNIMTDAMLVRLGLLLRSSPGPRALPSKPPGLEVKLVVGRNVTVRVYDTENLT